MKQLVENQRGFFYSGATKDYQYRKRQLHILNDMLKQNEEALYLALKNDLNKSKHEALTTELGLLYTEIAFSLKHMKEWMKDEQVETPLTHKGTKNYIHQEPYGVTLIISPWNYPVQLALLPVIAAITAGNTVVLKPSELAPHTSNVLAKLVGQYFPPNYFTVVEGDVTESNQLLAEKFDYIFFTGSTNVGKIIMEKASKYLTPVTLELGGKSPAIIDKDANIKLSAKRIVWGKYTNAGQTCVAPDYIYIHQKIYRAFIKQLKKEIAKLYGKQSLHNEDYVRIISKRHFERLTNLLDEGTIAVGGDYDETTLKIAPTVVENVTWEDPVMQEEIFGPILPVFSFESLEDVIKIINRQDKPLACYYFGENKKVMDQVVQEISFGGGCINDCLYHLANPHLPFGGVGASGMGAYHGKYGFKTFSHEKAIMKQTTLFDLPIRYPGSKVNFRLAKKLLGSKK